MLLGLLEEFDNEVEQKANEEPVHLTSKIILYVSETCCMLMLLGPLIASDYRNTAFLPGTWPLL